jgi:hypothetical protein
MFVNVESKNKKNKTKCGLFGERGRRQRVLCRALLANTLGNSGKTFPSSGVPSFAERSCTGRSTKKVFLKNKKPSLPTTFARGARHRFFSKKIEKQPLSTTFARGARHSFFQKKNRKTTFADSLCQGRSAQVFLKKIKNRGRRQRRFQKPST